MTIKSGSDNIAQIDLTKELILLDNVNMPFTSLLLKNGRQKATSTVVSWDYENLDTSRGLVYEGVDVASFQESDRTGGDSNKILQKAVSVSLTAQAVAVSAEHINDLFAHELRNRILEIKRDLEYYLINGEKDDGTGTGDNAAPRQMSGLLEFVDEDNVTNPKKDLDLSYLQAMAKTMKQAGTASQNLLLLSGYDNFEIIADLFKDSTYYQGIQNEFGSPVQRLNLTYGSAITYLVPDLDDKTTLLVNGDYLKIAELRPLAYHDLATTGSSRKGFIEMENTLKVLHPSAIVQFTTDTSV